jgi:lysophospholipase L1-like esterase
MGLPIPAAPGSSKLRTGGRGVTLRGICGKAPSDRVPGGSVKSVAVAAAWLIVSTVGTGCGRLPDWDVDRDGVVRLAILGDSNSFGLDPRNWCAKLRETLAEVEPGRWEIKAYGCLGARITGNPDPSRSGQAQVDRALAASPPVEVALLAFGTNDLQFEQTPREVIDAYGEAMRQFEQAGVRVLLAYTPPRYDDEGEAAVIESQNALLDAMWPNVPKIDFWSGVTTADMTPDKVHFTAEGHDKRRDAALGILFPWAGSSWRARWRASTRLFIERAAAALRRRFAE